MNGVPAHPDPLALAAAVVARLRERGQTLAVAESLTGGMLAATLVEVPGASAVLRGGVVAYAVDLKVKLVGVSAGLLAERGPVDPDVALALAAGVRRTCGADWGVGTTGVAGPEPHGGKPVGCVYVAVAGPERVRRVRELALAGDRHQVRVASLAHALELLRAVIDGHPPGAVGPTSDVSAAVLPDPADPAAAGPLRTG